MEKKKLLLVSVSVGLFLVIVIGASILVFSPRDYPSVTRSEAAPIPSGSPRAAVDVPREPVVVTEAPGTPQEAAQAPVAAEVEAQPKLENVIYINGETAENAVRVERLNDGNTRTIITIPSPRENVITPDAPPADAVPAKTASPPAVSAPAPAAAKPAPPESPSGGAKTEKPVPKTAWWVQTNSYSKKAYADTAKEFLASKGITSVVMNGNVGGKTFYRVRVGPYTSQSEADYWLSLIKTIEGMENSLVWKGSSL
ncbi:MAG: SPOR domain-containing protein [Spirochaetaceae bacterium]|jgi:DedD protein|nr:SPOR domain-containing protein [Spirochaetaceae bacterium]